MSAMPLSSKMAVPRADRKCLQECGADHGKAARHTKPKRHVLSIYRLNVLLRMMPLPYALLLVKRATRSHADADA